MNDDWRIVGRLDTEKAVVEANVNSAQRPLADFQAKGNIISSFTANVWASDSRGLTTILPQGERPTVREPDQETDRRLD